MKKQRGCLVLLFSILALTVGTILSWDIKYKVRPDIHEKFIDSLKIDSITIKVYKYGTGN